MDIVPPTADVPATNPSRLCGVLRDLVRIDSVNPRLVPGAAGEAAIAAYVERALRELELEVERREPEPGRVSVVGRLPGDGGGPSLMLNAHLDTVGTGGMAAPFAGEVREDRLFGRGAYDMKGGLAACLEAIRAVREAGGRLGGDLLLAAVADEEFGSLGTEDVLEEWSTDAAIVTEPTELELCVAHKGFVWLELETRGRAAHGSRFREGVDANLHMGRLLAGISDLERELRDRPRHPLLGPPSLHVGTLRGGTAPSIYAAGCTAVLERRTLPGETEADVVAEIRAVIERVRAEEPALEACVRPTLTRPPFEVQDDAAIVRTLAASAEEVLGHPPRKVGESPWMDSALLAAAGVETVVMGASGAGAHADEEWTELESVSQLAQILAHAATAYCRPHTERSVR